MNKKIDKRKRKKRRKEKEKEKDTKKGIKGMTEKEKRKK